MFSRSECVESNLFQKGIQSRASFGKRPNPYRDIFLIEPRISSDPRAPSEGPGISRGFLKSGDHYFCEYQ